MDIIQTANAGSWFPTALGVPICRPRATPEVAHLKILRRLICLRSANGISTSVSPIVGAACLCGVTRRSPSDGVPRNATSIWPTNRAQQLRDRRGIRQPQERD
jgi:hypothetical protein